MKKTNKILKITYILMAMLVIGTAFCEYTYGVSLPSGLSDIYKGKDDTIFGIGGQIIYIVQIVLYAAAVIALITAGVKYMAASPEGKAEIKKKMLYLVGGAVILFAAGAIVQLVGGLAMNNI